MKVALTPEVTKRIEMLRFELARLEVLERNGVEFEVVDNYAELAETEKLAILEGRRGDLTPAGVLELLKFTIEMCSVCYKHGATPHEPLTNFVDRLGAIARRTGSVGVH